MKKSHAEKIIFLAHLNTVLIQSIALKYIYFDHDIKNQKTIDCVNQISNALDQLILMQPNILKNRHQVHDALETMFLEVLCEVFIDKGCPIFLIEEMFSQNKFLPNRFTSYIEEKKIIAQNNLFNQEIKSQDGLLHKNHYKI